MTRVERAEIARFLKAATVGLASMPRPLGAVEFANLRQSCIRRSGLAPADVLRAVREGRLRPIGRNPDLPGLGGLLLSDDGLRALAASACPLDADGRADLNILSAARGARPEMLRNACRAGLLAHVVSGGSMRQRFRVRPDDADRFLRDFADIVTLDEACGGIGLRAVKLRLDAAGVRPAGAGGKTGRSRLFYLREAAETALLMARAARAPAEAGRDLDTRPFDEDEAPEEPRPR